MDEGTKKFTGGNKPRGFFDRRVRMQGGSVVVSLGKILPSNWAWVRVSKAEETPNLVVVHFERLELAPIDAQDTRDNKEGE